MTVPLVLICGFCLTRFPDQEGIKTAQCDPYRANVDA